MNEKELFTKLSLFKKIEPRKDWVFSFKQQILGAEPAKRTQFASIFETISFYWEKPAFALAAFMLLLGGVLLFQTANQPIEEEMTVSHLELVKSRLESILETSRPQDVQRLASGIEQIQEAEKLISERFIKLVENERKRALQAGLELVQLQKDKKELEKVLGASIGEEKDGLANATRILVENELNDLATRSLSEAQLAVFVEAKNAYEAGDYGTAIEKIWQLTNQFN